MSQADATSHRHSTPTPIPGTSSLQSYGIPSGPSTVPLPTSTPTSTPHATSSCYTSNTAYPTPSSATPTMRSVRTPTAASYNEAQMERTSERTTRQGAVLGMFTAPLRSLSSFSGHQYPPSVSHQVSEPELVGIRTTATALNSIASMI